MLTAGIGAEDQGIHDERAHRRARTAMYAVADGLTGKGLDILGQEWEEQYYLKAANAWGALCEATIGANGLFSWEYRAAEGCWTDAAQIAAMTMILLGAGNAAEACTGPSGRTLIWGPRLGRSCGGPAVQADRVRDPGPRSFPRAHPWMPS